MEIETGINSGDRASIGGALAKLLADTYLLYLKTQNFHWNITGGEFYSLHVLSQSQYEEMAEAVDEIAERIRALGFYVEGTLENFQKLSSLGEDSEIHPKHIWLQHLVKAHEVVIRDARSLASLAEKHGDHATVDMMGKRLVVHEKAAWMLRSQI